MDCFFYLEQVCSLCVAYIKHTEAVLRRLTSLATEVSGLFIFLYIFEQVCSLCVLLI